MKKWTPKFDLQRAGQRALLGFLLLLIVPVLAFYLSSQRNRSWHARAHQVPVKFLGLTNSGPGNFAAFSISNNTGENIEISRWAYFKALSSSGESPPSGGRYLLARLPLVPQGQLHRLLVDFSLENEPLKFTFTFSPEQSLSEKIAARIRYQLTRLGLRITNPPRPTCTIETPWITADGSLLK